MTFAPRQTLSFYSSPQDVQGDIMISVTSRSQAHDLWGGKSLLRTQSLLPCIKASRNRSWVAYSSLAHPLFLLFPPQGCTLPYLHLIIKFTSSSTILLSTESSTHHHSWRKSMTLCAICCGCIFSWVTGILLAGSVYWPREICQSMHDMAIETRN